MTTTPWLDDAEQRVWRRWLASHVRLGAALTRRLADDTGMSMPDFEVLVHLSEAPQERLRVAELASGLQWERSRLSHHLTRMEARGLVVRQECPSDRRGAFAVLTRAGREAIEAAAPGHVRAVRELFLDALDAADLAALDTATAKVVARVDERAGP